MRCADRSHAFLVVPLAVAAAGAAFVSCLAATPPAGVAAVLLAALVYAALAIAVAASIISRRQKHAPSTVATAVSDDLSQLIEAAHAVAWDRDVRCGTDVFFGDLQSTLGLPERCRAGTDQEFQQRIHPDDRARVGETIAEAMDSRTRYRASFRVVAPDGAVHWLESSGQFSYDASGAPVRMLGIAIDVTDRRLLEQTLDESRTLLDEVIQSASDPILVLDERRHVRLFNPAAERLFGCTAAAALGAPVGRFIVHSAETSPAMDGSDGLTAAPPIRRPGSIERCWGRRDGDEPFPIEVSASEADVAGRTRHTLIVRDLRERLRAENALREGEQRFRRIADSVPMLLWVSGLDKGYTYFNRGWLRFTGRTLEQELGIGWAEGVLPEHFQRWLETYERAFDRREPFTMEYQLRRHDGQYRWVLDSGLPRFGPDGAFAGYVGSAVDITDLKSARSMLADFGQRLLQAHEIERTRVARDLHDDIGQRIAVLTMDLDSLAAMMPAGNVDARRRLRVLSARAVELARDVQALSHRLHSSKLDHLGLVSASAGLCRELSAQHGIGVVFNAEGVPEDLPPKVALGVFRVLQEALSNALKHGRSELVQATLNGTPAAIQLEVVDGGAGFDVTAAMRGGGLGLISMHERISLLNGQLQVESRRGAGTRVHATIPLADPRPAIE